MIRSIARATVIVALFAVGVTITVLVAVAVAVVWEYRRIRGRL